MKHLLYAMTLAVILITGTALAATDAEVKQIFHDASEHMHHPDTVIPNPFGAYGRNESGMSARNSFAEATGKKLTSQRGVLSAAAARKQFGIGTTKAYSYRTFAFTYGEVAEQLTREDKQKLLIVLALPAIIKARDEKKNIFFSAANIVAMATQVSPSRLLDIDDFYAKGNVRRTNRYQGLFRALFTGDTAMALTAIRGMDGDFVRKAEKEFTRMSSEK